MKCGMLAPKPLLCLALLQFALFLGAQAQSYSIDWYKIAGGGGASTGGLSKFFCVIAS